MNLSKKIILIAAVGLCACSGPKVRVMPGENGMNTAVVRTATKETGEDAVNEAAFEYCEKQKKTPVFMEEKSRYTGKMDEETRKTVRNASTAAVVLGGFGSPVQTAGQAGGMMTSDRDYESKVVFKCK